MCSGQLTVRDGRDRGAEVQRRKEPPRSVSRGTEDLTERDQARVFDLHAKTAGQLGMPPGIAVASGILPSRSRCHGDEWRIPYHAGFVAACTKTSYNN